MMERHNGGSRHEQLTIQYIPLFLDMILFSLFPRLVFHDILSRVVALYSSMNCMIAG